MLDTVTGEIGKVARNNVFRVIILDAFKVSKFALYRLGRREKIAYKNRFVNIFVGFKTDKIQKLGILTANTQKVRLIKSFTDGQKKHSGMFSSLIYITKAAA